MRGAGDRSRQRGAALILVLWAALLISVVLASALGLARIEARIAGAERDRLRADLAIDAALDEAGARLAFDEESGNARIVEGFTLNGYVVDVALSVEEQKLDLNKADEAVLALFLIGVGLPKPVADRLAAQIADWRDEDDLARPNGAEASDYAAARTKRIGNRPFESIDELVEVLSIDESLYHCIAPALTLFGRGGAPGPDAMALIGRLPLIARPRGRAVLGASLRGAPAGAVRVLEATARKDAGARRDQRRRTRVIRITGNAEKPFEQIAEITIGTSAESHACSQEDRTNLKPAALQ